MEATIFLVAAKSIHIIMENPVQPVNFYMIAKCTKDRDIIVQKTNQRKCTVLVLPPVNSRTVRQFG